MLMVEDNKTKRVISKTYNSYFNKETGLFARWGETKDEDPIKAPLPEIADIEISSGMCHNSCPFCYKQNSINNELHNMTFNEFRDIFFKLAKTVVKVEFPNGDSKEYSIANSDNGYFKMDMFAAYESWTGKVIRTKADFINAYKEEYKNHEDYDKLKFSVYNKGLLSQIAFGITSPNDNPDFFEMMKFAKEFDVIPNYTCNGTDMTQEVAEKSVGVCGAIAISCCSDKEASYNAIKRLTDLGLEQVNVHYVAMNTTFCSIMQLLEDTQTDNRLKGLNAIVLLKYKPKGTNAGMFKPLTQEQYNKIFNKATELGVGIGFDSCSCHEYLNLIKGKKAEKQLSQFAEPCESTLFSIYINSYGVVFPCSFSENEYREDLDWQEGINLLKTATIEEIWNSDRFNLFRNSLLNNERKCPMYNLEEQWK